MTKPRINVGRATREDYHMARTRFRCRTCRRGAPYDCMTPGGRLRAPHATRLRDAIRARLAAAQS